MPVNILAIESSCDDTSASVLTDGLILSNEVAGQKVHEQYGGVIPELASRAHQQNIVPVVDVALKKAGVEPNQLCAIAFTLGPGLIGSLMVGSSFAKAMAMSLQIPIITVNHMKAHVLAHFIDDMSQRGQRSDPALNIAGFPNEKIGITPLRHPTFPFLCLTVSGGHTQIVLAEDYMKLKVIGETTDDAAGEAFDKSAKLLGLPYPGGPLIDKYAHQGNPKAFHFPEPQIPNLDFSFSGLKTSILYFLRDNKKKDEQFVEKNLNDICASIQQRIVTILLNKLIKASEETGIREIAIAGGVSANSGLRKAIVTEGEKRGWKTYIPKFEYCTDNAAMIAMAAYYQYLAKDFATLDAAPMARMEF